MFFPEWNQALNISIPQLEDMFKLSLASSGAKDNHLT